jgi:predicted dehydrogenase
MVMRKAALGDRPLRMAMVGGGPGSFIGPVHRMAAELDGEIRLTAGVFSRTAERSRQAGAQYRIDPDRTYATYRDLFAAERERPDGVDLVAICTPNDSHLAIASAALGAGFAVICDKPATATYAEALALQSVVEATGGLFALSYTYTGYPLLREARELCLAGGLGAIRKVVVEYTQGWLGERLEHAGSRQAMWRTNPAQAGEGGCVADIGIHAFNALEFATGLQVSELLADLTSVIAGRRLSNGAPGVLHASQVATGARNGLRVRIWGERGGVDWRQESPNALHIDWAEGHSEVRRAGSPNLSAAAAAACRLPAGHPEGFIEAFANIYRDFAQAVRDGGAGPAGHLQMIDAGVRGLAFVNLANTSSRSRAWSVMPTLRKA